MNKGGKERMDKKQEEALLRAYAEKTGKKISELRQLLERAKQEAAELGYPDNDNVIKSRMRRKVNAVLFAEQTGHMRVRKEPVVFTGFLLGADAIRDLKEQMRRKALRIFEEEGDTAKIEGYVDDAGTPLDWRPTIRNKRGEEVDNPDYHKPIIGHQYVRDIFGIVVKEGDNTPKLFQMSLWGGFATRFTYRPFVPIQFKCTIKSEGPYYVLNPPRVPKGEKAFKTISKDINVEEWIRTALKDRTYAFVDIEKAVKATETAKDPWILVEGTVDYIDPEINPKTGSRNLALADVDSGITDTIRVFIPKDFPLAFREFSKVLVFGRPRAWQRDDESEVRYSINGISIYPIPGETIEGKIDTGIPAEGEVETEEEGWDLWE